MWAAVRVANNLFRRIWIVHDLQPLCRFFVREDLVHIHHGDEAINASLDGREVPSKSNYIREHVSVATKHVHLDKSSACFKPALMTPHNAPHLQRRGKVSSSGNRQSKNESLT